MKTLYYALIVALSFACSGAAKKKQSTNPNKTGGTGPVATGNSSQRDVIFVNAIGDEATEYAPAQQQALTNLLTGLVKKFASEDARLIVFASPTATLSKVSINTDVPGVDKSRVLQVNFEMAPRDAFLGTAVAGCAAADSNLDVEHTAGTITVCSQVITVPEHSWAWGVEDLKGKMETFVRPGARRDYVIIASNDAVLLSADEFAAITKTQNAGQAPRVFLLAPDKIEAPCVDLHKPAFALVSLAQSSGGKAFEFCQSDWTNAVTEIVNAL